jgi:hypothetical protein
MIGMITVVQEAHKAQVVFPNLALLRVLALHFKEEILPGLVMEELEEAAIGEAVRGAIQNLLCRAGAEVVDMYGQE